MKKINKYPYFCIIIEMTCYPAKVFQDSDEDEMQGSHGIRRRHPVQKIEPGSMNILSAKYEVSNSFLMLYFLKYFPNIR